MPTCEIRLLFAEAAVRAGVIRPSDSINQLPVDSATEIVALCAQLADRYPNPECIEDTIGNVIRGQLLKP